MKEIIIDLVPELTKKHIDEALKTARKSVTRTVFLNIKGFGKI
jgi:hypothetical protein